jgi:hypothetical protein
MHCNGCKFPFPPHELRDGLCLTCIAKERLTLIGILKKIWEHDDTLKLSCERVASSKQD